MAHSAGPVHGDEHGAFPWMIARHSSDGTSHVDSTRRPSLSRISEGSSPGPPTPLPDVYEDIRPEGERRANRYKNGRNGDSVDGSCRRYSEDSDSDAHPPERLGFKQRVKHFTWTWFAMTMATSGVANMLYAVPFRFSGLYEIGCCFALLNIIMFCFNVAMISIRFYLYRPTFRASLIHPTESLFAPSAIISFGTLLTNITQYGSRSALDPGHGLQDDAWLMHTMGVLFWVYCALSVVFSCGVYLVLWSTQSFTISRMTPIWIFPAYPLLIAGTFAGQLADKLPSDKALLVILGGFTLQATGFMVAFMIYGSFIYRLMTEKLPREPVRPGMFVSVGPSSFAISGLMAMARHLPTILEAMDEFMDTDSVLAGTISMVIANWIGIWLWGLALWFFLVSIGAHYSCVAKGSLDFGLTWYSFVFPNTALATATFSVARVLGPSRGIQIFGCVISCAVVLAWIFVFGMTIRAVIIRQVLWPQMQEDRDEGGFAGGQVETETMTTVRAAAALEDMAAALATSTHGLSPEVQEVVRRRRAGTLERMLREKEEDESLRRFSTHRSNEWNGLMRARTNIF